MAANSQFSMAVHVMAVLASRKDEKIKSEMIASSVNTNPVVIRRLIGNLSDANLVESQTGSAGGSRLARCPSEITLAEVYRAVSCGEVFALHGKAPDQNCPVGRNIEAVLCNLQKVIEKSVGEKLSAYTLQSVLDGIAEQQ
ncbi:MAG: Rrf2 family transcriptional regulator [Pyrinomonadaceae bacterium]